MKYIAYLLMGLGLAGTMMATPSTKGTNLGLRNAPTVVYFPVSDTIAQTKLSELDEAYLVPEEIQVQIDEMSGLPFVDFDAIYDSHGKVKKIAVDVNIQTGWSNKTWEAFDRKLNDDTLRLLLAASTSEFESFRFQPISGLTLEKLFSPEDKNVMTEPNMPEPLRIWVEGEALDSLACAMTAYRQVIGNPLNRSKLSDQAREKVLETNPLNFLVGRLSQTYQMTEVTGAGSSVSTTDKIVPRRLVTKIEKPSLLELSQLDRIFLKAVESYDLRCRLPLQPITPNYQAPEIHLYGFDEFLDIMVQSEIVIDWRQQR